MFAQTGLERGGKKIFESLIEEDSDEKEIINVIKSAANFEIGFEVGISNSKVPIGESDEATMSTENKIYYSYKFATTFENLPEYKLHETAGTCSDSYNYTNCIPYYWELTFSSLVMDRQELDGENIFTESQKMGTEINVDTYQFTFTVVPKDNRYYGKDFDLFLLYGIVVQHNIIKGDYYKTNFDEPNSIAEKKCDDAKTPSDVINFCEKKTINKRGYSGGVLFGGHWVIPKYHSNLGIRISGADSLNAQFYYGFYYAF